MIICRTFDMVEYPRHVACLQQIGDPFGNPRP